MKDDSKSLHPVIFRLCNSSKLFVNSDSVCCCHDNEYHRLNVLVFLMLLLSFWQRRAKTFAVKRSVPAPRSTDVAFA